MSNKLARAPSRTKEFWLTHIKQWRNSGLSKIAYCRQNNLSANNFYNCSSKESSNGERHAQGQSPTELKFLPVSVADTVTKATIVTVQCNALKFSFPAGLSTDDIERWLNVIDREYV